MQRVNVTLAAVDAWEVWSCQIPDGVDPEEYIAENLGDLDLAFEEAGNRGTAIESIEIV